MWLRTKDGEWYIYQIHGAVFVSWVNKRRLDLACVFPEKDIKAWKELMSDTTGKELEAVKPSPFYDEPDEVMEI